jgi:uncharacterized membrane protein (UPF0136 family)
VIGIYLLITKHKVKFNLTVLIGAVSMAGVTTCYAIANKLTTAGNTIILQYTAPVWIMVLVYLFFGRKPNRTGVISLLIVFAGILCFFFEGLSTGKWLGDLIALISGIFYAGVFMLNSSEKGDALSSVFLGQLNEPASKRLYRSRNPLPIQRSPLILSDRLPQKRNNVPFSKGFWWYLSPIIMDNPSIPFLKSTVPHASTTLRIPAASSSM